MRKGILLSLMMMVSCLIFAQTADRVLVSNGGGSFEAGDYQADVSIGEPVIETVASGDFVLTQGFQQTMLTITDVEQLLEVDVEMFPNPTSEYLNIQFPVKEFSNVELQVVDLSGKLVCQIQLDEDVTSIDVFAWTSGTYIFRIIADDEFVQTCKVIKQ